MNAIERPSDPPVQEEPPIITGSREQLLYLLAEAAEIEHTLMCCYLYAAFSLKRDGDSGLSPPEADATTRWRATIVDVAVQEMGHLVLVANLTVALGGRPHFSRPNFPVSAGYFPSGVVARLSGFSTETLDHFIFLERPQGHGDADSEQFEQHDYRREQRLHGLMPSAQEYETIGHLYEAIRTNIVALADSIGEENLLIGSAREQMGEAVIQLEGVAAIETVDDALRAIDTIIDQGEGSPSDRDESHYRSFVAIRDEYQALERSNPDFAPAWPVADNPVLRRPPEPEGKVFIEHLEAATLLDFGCACYGLLIRMLVQCFGRGSGDTLADQKALMETAITLMHALGTVGDALARLPASPADAHVHAGMSFTMLRGAEPLVSGPAEELLLKEQLSRLATGWSRLPPRAKSAKLDLHGVADRFALSTAQNRATTKR